MCAKVEETDMDVDSFAVLQTVWVKAVGIPKFARKESVVMELAFLAGDPEEVLNPWSEVWVKVACKDPKLIKGTAVVYINKQGYKITWVVAGDKGPIKPPANLEGRGNDDDEATDEEDPDSQDSDAWLDEGKRKTNNQNESGPSKIAPSSHPIEQVKHNSHQHNEVEGTVPYTAELLTG